MKRRKPSFRLLLRRGVRQSPTRTASICHEWLIHFKGIVHISLMI
ncbi:hypothetical protein [Roseomonas genomospecies 6]|nr:hypothetical protein [Roseomonas genomospecies 6]